MVGLFQLDHGEGPLTRNWMYAHNMVWPFLSAMSLSQTDRSFEQSAGRKKPNAIFDL